MSGAGAVDLRLVCKPGKQGNIFVFDYTLENHGAGIVYAMDAVATVDESREGAKVDPQAPVVLHGPNEDATIGKFIAPLPTDRRVAMPVIPLARRLPPGGTVAGHIEIPGPLAESSPYFADLPLRQYEVVDIKGVVFGIGYWPDGVDGLAALPSEYAPDLYIVVTRRTARSAGFVWQRFPTRGLQLFRRTDDFPREIVGVPALALASAARNDERRGPGADVAAAGS
jgi:hypothetical protein